MHCSYVGVMQLEFLQYCTNAGLAVGPNLITGNGMGFLVGRISYTFGLKGPCIRCEREPPLTYLPAHAWASPMYCSNWSVSKCLMATRHQTVL